MRIAHVNNPANLAWNLAEGQRMLGHEAVVFRRWKDPYDFQFDVDVPTEWREKPFLWRALKDFDIVHVHSGLPRTNPLYGLVRLFRRIPYAIHYYGGEVRIKRQTHWQRGAQILFYTAPDLAPMLPERAIPVRKPIVLEDIPHVPNYLPTGRPVFSHFMSTPKGTEEIVRQFGRAFGPLDWYDFEGAKYVVAKDAELRIFRGIKHRRALMEMALSDIVIDQVSPHGIYGYVAVEAMALGKPVFAIFNRDYYPPQCPIITTLRPPKLMELAYHEDARRHYGHMGREYVERVHDARVVAQKVMEGYGL